MFKLDFYQKSELGKEFLSLGQFRVDPKMTKIGSFLGQPEITKYIRVSLFESLTYMIRLRLCFNSQLFMVSIY